MNIATNEQKIIFFTTSAVYIRRHANIKNKKRKNNIFYTFLSQQIFYLFTSIIFLHHHAIDVWYKNVINFT